MAFIGFVMFTNRSVFSLSELIDFEFANEIKYRPLKILGVRQKWHKID